jgi:glycosyltransferase involved in cell wall biosynthesis
MVQDGRLGLVVPPRDIQALASAIIRFFQEELGTGFQRNIRAERDIFSWERLVTLIEEILGDVE